MKTSNVDCSSSLTGLKAIPYLLLLFITVCIDGCHEKSQQRQWDAVTINSAIVGNIAYRQLDNDNEVFSAFEKHDTSAKRSSGVLYSTKALLKLSDSNAARFNNCRAYLLSGDTLSIDIGIGNGFSGWGFSIAYKNMRFHTQPYYFTDVVIPNAPKPNFNLVYQNLTLDKPAYKVGDSLYGKVSFKSIETNQQGSRIEHFGNGYFRTVVTTPEFFQTARVAHTVGIKNF